ncbi:hypothetical protein PV08_12022 [Exophiala spinifera]|uniref:Nucleoside phosphorylase domain-containing protein n=1 Tax=Exophiala spinifera TaxID=91928 RepID=A0A0D2ASN9_9EURO|nr:uncharacterized protein PV08_12022 [Exophiala spinifera]KIW09738.1 hypothetical protein PV08_12022 [Exophiala spinifera]
MSLSGPPRDRRSFKVAIICALTLEAEKVRAVFDRCWEDEGKRYGKADGDRNTYTTGVMGKHNVVLAHMARMGSVNASAVATGLRSSFPSIQLALVVGICGVVPVHPNTHEEIVLGDIVISTSVIQYDFGRQYPNGFQRKSGVEDSLGRANSEIQSFINMLQVRDNRTRLTRNLAALLQSEGLQKALPDAKYPGASQDKLYEATYIHRHRLDSSCDQCSSDGENCYNSCDEIGCGQARLILRDRHSLPQTGDLLHRNDTPFIHFGRFGSANTVMKSGEDRDRMAQFDAVAAFEMEGAGVWDQHPTIVIKAACDYADSHKSKAWQGYAAAMAAACVKVFLDEWSVVDEVTDKDESSSPVWHVPFDGLSGFVGRIDEIARLKELLFTPNSRRIASILGLGGIGKSRLALELAFQQKKEHPYHSVFWIEASEQLTFERDVLEIGKKLRIPGIGDDKADIKNLLKQRLSHSSNEKWLLIVDNADDEMLWGRRADASEDILSLEQFLPNTAHGSIVITTRSRAVATFMAGKGVIELDQLSPAEGVKLFREALEKPDLADNDATIFVLTEKLAGLPLALIQAASFINMTQESAQMYLRLLEQPEDDVIKLLSEDFGDPSRYPNAKNPIATTWLISFDRIRKHHNLAAKILSSMACMNEKNIPRSLLPKGNSEIEMVKALAILTGYSFIKRHARSDSVTSFDEMYDLHRLVQLAARNWLKMENSLSDWTKSCLEHVAEIFPARQHHNRGIWTIYLPHAQRICDDDAVQDCAERYELLEKMGLCFIVDGKYTDAIAAHTLVVQWKEQYRSSLEQHTLESYNHLGEALLLKGEFVAAKASLEKAFNGLMESLGAQHPSTLTSMANLASTYRHQGRWTQAEELEVQVMETMKRVLGEEHPSTLTSMGNLASTYRHQGRWTQAEKLEVQYGQPGIDIPAPRSMDAGGGATS